MHTCFNQYYNEDTTASLGERTTVVIASAALFDAPISIWNNLAGGMEDHQAQAYFYWNVLFKIISQSSSGATTDQQIGDCWPASRRAAAGRADPPAHPQYWRPGHSPPRHNTLQGDAILTSQSKHLASHSRHPDISQRETLLEKTLTVIRKA